MLHSSSVLLLVLMVMLVMVLLAKDFILVGDAGSHVSHLSDYHLLTVADELTCGFVETGVGSHHFS